MIEIYTIGFTKKTAQTFFELLVENKVSQILDTRIHNNSQLAGFAKAQDLAFFARKIAAIDYSHHIDFAPTKELLSAYRKKEISWSDYEMAYLNLLDMRRIGDKIKIEDLHQNCLLCSEHSPEKCHRRLLAEYLQARFNDIEIKHLK
ncbi:MAG: DUF488 domain-containing protein [Bernardetiaceae bacterium]|nr:DUF488 domain-containing protein [Bernardetiaceae bacterium]